jgi:hypothetical protein
VYEPNPDEFNLARKPCNDLQHLVGACEATFLGGSIVWLMTMLTIGRIRQIWQFRLEARHE